MATPRQRQEALARQGLTERRNGNGATEVFRFANPEDTRPTVLQDNLRSVGDLWQEWEHGIAGAKPAKEWKPHETSGNDKYSTRRPIWDVLDCLVPEKGKLPAEAFRIIGLHYPQYMRSMTKLGKAIRDDANAEPCTLHPDLRPREYRVLRTVSNNRSRNNNKT
jgi:Transcriptional activator of glycolytic enzymes